MPIQKEVDEKYLSICYLEIPGICIKWCKFLGVPYPCGVKTCTWKIPYPCIKTRKVTKWCYTFSVVHENCYALGAELYGCENGKEYKWHDWCFGWFDAYHDGPLEICFDDPLEDLGFCREGKSLPKDKHWHDPDDPGIGGPVGFITIALIGNSETKEIHKEECNLVESIIKKNKISFKNLEEAKKQGYIECKHCFLELKNKEKT